MSRTFETSGHTREGTAGAATRVLFVALAAAALLPWTTPGLALGAGALFALLLGNPYAGRTAGLSRWLLQASVVGLGFGMSLSAVWSAGASGIGYTVAGIATALSVGWLLGRWLGVEGKTAYLITAGTSICGGSAIAAVGPVIGAGAEAMSVSLATVFVLNGVALYLFPAIGHLLGLTQGQFAVWAAVAIHDTSSVVGAAASYGPQALQRATVLKLARALWILPLGLATALWVGRRGGGAGEGRGRVKVPWFIGFFLLAALARSLAPAPLLPALGGLARLARTTLVLTLFLIGAGLSRTSLRAVGPRPLLHGALLWLVVGGLSLLAVWARVPG